MSAVEVARKRTLKVVHAVGQVWLGRSQKQVKVVVEQCVSEDSPAEALRRLGESVLPVPAVVIVDDNVSSIDASVGDMVDAVWKVDTRSSRHEIWPGAVIVAYWQWGLAYDFQFSPESTRHCELSFAPAKTENRKPDPSARSMTMRFCSVPDST